MYKNNIKIVFIINNIAITMMMNKLQAKIDNDIHSSVCCRYCLAPADVG